MIYVSIKEKRGENVRCKIQARIGKERTNHVARFDLFLEFSFFLLTFFPCHSLHLSRTLTKLSEALLLPVCHC